MGSNPIWLDLDTDIHDKRASQVALVVKNLPASSGDVRDVGSIPESGRSPGDGNGDPLQYSCLENTMYRRTWRAKVYGAIVSQTPLRDQVHTVSRLKYYKLEYPGLFGAA